MGTSAAGWREVVSAAVSGTLLAVLLVLLNVQMTGLSPLNVIQAGGRGPAAATIQRDFPDTPLASGVGHDGQQFYAVARQPMHWHGVADDVDRAPYRLQRPLLPWLGWLLHPTGGGTGLVVALFAVGIAASFAGAVALGVLAVSFGRSPQLGVLFPLLPGALVSLRITTADTLAVALALVAVACLVRGRTGLAIVAAVAAVLAKETTVLIVLGYAVWRRDRRSIAVAAVPVAVGVGLWVVLRLAFPDSGPQIVEFTFPLVGLVEAIPHFTVGHDRLAMVSVVVTLAGAGAAIRLGGLRNPFAWSVVLQLALLAALRFDVWALDLNGTRATLPLAVCAILALAATPKRDRAQKPAEIVTASP